MKIDSCKILRQYIYILPPDIFQTFFNLYLFRKNTSPPLSAFLQLPIKIFVKSRVPERNSSGYTWIYSLLLPDSGTVPGFFPLSLKSCARPEHRSRIFSVRSIQHLLTFTLVLGLFRTFMDLEKVMKSIFFIDSSRGNIRQNPAGRDEYCTFLPD